MLAAAMRSSIGRWLEEGALSGRCSRALAGLHAPIAGRLAVARPLDLTRGGQGIAVITVGGATLGGSGKTRVALACARELVARGKQVVVVSHGYRARRSGAWLVSATDRLADVGDEALACARALSEFGSARVVVASSRQEAFDLAVALAPRADAIIIDGPLQLAPVRASLALLALDAAAPWGAGNVAPAGDLRAPRTALLAAADHIVMVDATPHGALLDGRAVDLAALAASVATSRVGLFTAIGRPDRLLEALARAGISPRSVVRAPDHGPVSAGLARALARTDVDLWLATAKCAVHLERLDLGRPLAILDGSMLLTTEVRGALACCVAASPT